MVDHPYEYSILIPSWKNPDYLQNCIEGIFKNSELNFEIIVFLNEDCPKSRAYLEGLHEARIQILADPENVGICIALNRSRTLVRSPYLLYLNDDMYPLSGWDNILMQAMRDRNGEAFISSTMVEPQDTGNPCVRVANFGESLDTFQKEALENQLLALKSSDWQGATWPPCLLTVELWDTVGGMSIEYSPGYYSDPDLSMKIYQAGIRDFLGVGLSLVYHFGKKSTSRIPASRGKSIFLYKWGMSVSHFYAEILQLGTPYRGALPALGQAKKSWWQSLKKIWYSWRM